ncbi:MAG: hypothetical protein LBN38_07630 [Verrucomicrobiota bacterium]|jgi:hypothetical protein|nr:hypothetical protein [Verrucomicrobiota bacterium]
MKSDNKKLSASAREIENLQVPLAKMVHKDETPKGQTLPVQWMRSKEC